MSNRPPTRKRNCDYDSSKRNRRHSYTYVRSSTPYGESDEGEFFEQFGYAYKVPAQSQSQSRSQGHKPAHSSYLHDYDRVWYTNLDHYSQEIPTYYDTSYSRDPSYEMPRPIAPGRTGTAAGFSHSRRASINPTPPARPSTVRPVSSQLPQTSSRRAVASATVTPDKAKEKLKKQEAAARHKIPVGFSLKNWDHEQPPILLLGSVFDANSLGKWIYDWTVHSVGSRKPIAEIAGDLWLLLLELAEKTDYAEKTFGIIRSKEKKDTVFEFIESSERLQSSFRHLLKACEAPMLRASKTKKNSLGENAGIEFVHTLFGRDAELAKTEKWMQKVRTWSLRFDSNAEPILRKPTA